MEKGRNREFQKKIIPILSNVKVENMRFKIEGAEESLRKRKRPEEEGEASKKTEEGGAVDKVLEQENEYSCMQHVAKRKVKEKDKENIEKSKERFENSYKRIIEERKKELEKVEKRGKVSYKELGENGEINLSPTWKAKGIKHVEGIRKKENKSNLIERLKKLQEGIEVQEINDENFLSFFEVTLEFKNSSKEKKINFIRIFRFLRRYEEYIGDIKMTNKRVAEVRLKNPHTGRMVFRKLSEESIEGITMRIPKRAKERWGVIRHWEFSPQELEEAAEPGQNIKSVERMKRRVKTDGGFGYIDSQLMLIKFNGESLPTKISVFDRRVWLNITPYVRNVKQCFTCLKFGHVSKFCRVTVKPCFVCGEERHGECNKVPYCVNCGGEHKSVSRECMAWQLEFAINKIVAFKNMGYLAAIPFVCP